MKTKKPELDVDFIGGQRPLTAEEEKALSSFFKKRKQALAKKKIAKQQLRAKKLPNVTA